MATISERLNKDGTIVFRVYIRKKDCEISKTFYNKEDAELYVFYKENLLNNMSNFEVDIKERVTLNQIMELKLQNFNNKRTREDFINTVKKMQPFISKTFLHEMDYEDWILVAKGLLDTKIINNGKERQECLSLSSVRRYFACLSSAISYANELGINIENYPLKVIQQFIRL